MNLKGKSDDLDLYIRTFLDFRADQVKIIERSNKLDEQCNEFYNILRERRAELEELQQNIIQHEQELLDLRTADENLDIEIIRARSQLKKSKKYLSKMQTMNASKTKMDVDDADKGKVLKVQLRLKVLKSLLEFHINKELKGFSLVSGESTLKPLNISNALSNEIIRGIFWDNCRNATTQNSENSVQWKSLFS